VKELMGLGYRAPFHSHLMQGHPEIGQTVLALELVQACHRLPGNDLPGLGGHATISAA
jgi:serine kinase of HPr protein (carbohydrate metabolism regulator)